MVLKKNLLSVAKELGSAVAMAALTFSKRIFCVSKPSLALFDLRRR